MDILADSSPAASLPTSVYPHEYAATEAATKSLALIGRLSHATMPENSEGRNEQTY